MKTKLHASFRKYYKNRVVIHKKLISQTELRIDLFRSNPQNPILKDHALSGTKKGLRAFSVTGDIRIVYRPISEDEVVFIDIGSHNQVY